MKQIISLLLLISIFYSCKKEENYPVDETTLEINDFIWKAMNNYYLWKDEMPSLADDAFDNQDELNTYLSNYSNPENLFESLIYQRDDVDRWSWIVSDYEELIKLFSGIRKTTGMRIGLVYENGSDYYIFAYVKYVLPGSEAEAKGIKRGDIFRKIYGQRMNLDNYVELLSNNGLQIELAQWNGNDLTDTGNLIYLPKTQIKENPVFIKKVLQHNGKKIGYLMLNGFTSNYNLDLNMAFGYFQSENIDELVVDLRYNPGGAVSTMQSMASMITGQFTGQVLLKYNWNQQLQTWMQENYPASLHRNFVDYTDNGLLINHLNLSKVYIIATSSSASASESLINCLRPYIDVVQIGTTTHGKYTASVTLFDSPDFLGSNINPNHKWALQPIVLKVSNAEGTTDFVDGLHPDIYQPEDLHNLGILGEESELLLSTALNHIDNNIPVKSVGSPSWHEVYYMENKHLDEMYIDNQELPVK